MSNLISIDDAERDLFSCAAYIAENIRSADGHSEAINAILPYYLAKGEVDTAAALADTIEDPFMRDKLLTLVAERCAQIDDDEYAFQLVEAVEDYGLQATAREKLGLVKCGKGEFDKAFEIADSLEHPDNVLAAIAVNAEQDGKPDVSAEALEGIEFPYAKVLTLQTVAGARISAGEKSAAAELLERAVAAADEIDFAEEKIRALIEIATLFTDAGRGDRAIETLDRAKELSLALENVHRDAFLGAVSFGFFRAGSVTLADAALDMVVDKTQIASVLTGFSRQYQEKGETDDALETLEEAHAMLQSQHERETRDSRAKFRLFGAIAGLFAEFGRFERAIEIADAVAGEEERIEALSAIAVAATTRGESDFAKQALSLVEADSHRLSALVAIAGAHRSKGDDAAALATLREAADLAETVPQLAARSASMNEMTQAFAELGDAQAARSLASENLRTIAQIKDESSVAVCLAGLSGVYTANSFELTEDEKKLIKTVIVKSVG